MEFILYLIFVGLVGYFASRRGRSPIIWGLVALIFSPILAAIIIAVMRDLSLDQKVEQNSLETDRLKERVAVSEAEIHSRIDKVEKRIDRMQGKEDDTFIEGEWREALPEPEQTHRYCSQCGEKVPQEAGYCPSCGSKLV